MVKPSPIAPPLFILGHLGLGDAILCNGLCRVLADRHGAVQIPVYPHNLATVRFMFSDDPRIEVVEAQDSAHAMAMAEASKNALKLGFYADGVFDAKVFDQEFYRQAGVEFSERWDSFKLPIWTGPIFSVDEAFEGKPVVHHDPKRGFLIAQKYLGFQSVFIEPTRGLFEWLPVMRGASEVHVINSSLLILWDSMPHVEGQKLFFHRYPRPTDHPQLRKPWEIIN